MSDNEQPDSPTSTFESDAELSSANEDDLIDASDDEKKTPVKTKKTTKQQVVAQTSTKTKTNVDEDDEDFEDGDEEDGDFDDFELSPVLIEKELANRKKYSIVTDPRDYDEITKPGPRIKREILVDRQNYKSAEYMQIFEFCDLVGVRAKHISDGADVYVDIENETTAREIAKKELQLGLCPFLLKRYMTPMNYDPVYVEIWDPNDMAINAKFFDN